MSLNTDMLLRLGFQHQEFPDGWFWFLQPEETEPLWRLAWAMGFVETDVDELPDTIILQCENSLTNWSYVFGPEVGTLTDEEAVTVLSRLSEQPGN